MATSPKVSVIVPTYCPGERIYNVVNSLDAQSMPQSEFEVLLIDDGSPDNTVSMLTEIASARKNFRVYMLEHSGWPSTARNFGIEKANGRYVLFMDHDDALYPDSLAKGYEFASKNSADVLNGKEARTDQPKWALSTFRADLNNAIDRADVHPLVPTNPHKLYRRQLLIDNQIRFPEGERVLWEDVFFNLEVAEHAKIVSTMSSTPFYHWVQHENNTSKTFTQDLQAYWHGLKMIFESTASHLKTPTLEAQRTLMFAYQYETRLIPALGPALWEHDLRDVSFALQTARQLVLDFLPTEYDLRLSAYGKARAKLLRAGEFDLLRRLVQVDSGMRGIATCHDAAWHHGELEIRSVASWRTAAGNPLALTLASDGRILRELPSDLAEALGNDLLDVTTDVYAARTTLGLKSRASKVTWLIPTTCRTEILGTLGGRAEITVRSTATLNINSAALGAELESDVWDFNAKNELFGIVNHRSLRSKKVAAAAVIERRALEAYVNRKGMLSLDMDQRLRTVARPDLDGNVRARVSGWGKIRVAIPLKKLALSRTELTCFLQLGDQAPTRATIENRGHGNYLYATITSALGRHALRVGSSPKKLHNTGRELAVFRFGKVELK